jgi:hypothetical protein
MVARFSFFSRVAAALCALAMLTAAPSFAQYSSPNFEVVNEGHHTIVVINVSPHGYNSWGADLLGNDELEPGYWFKPLIGYNLPSCIQDVRVIYSDNVVDYMYSVNVCTHYVTFSY